MWKERVSNLSKEDTVRVSDLMQTKVIAIRSDATLAEAIDSLADAHVSGLPVVDGHGRLVGVVTSTDVIEAEAEHKSGGVMKTLVSEIMTRTPFTVAPDLSLGEAAQQMLYAEVRRLFVKDKGKLVGVISQTDIVRAVATGHLPNPAPDTAAPFRPAGGRKGGRAGARNAK